MTAKANVALCHVEDMAPGAAADRAASGAEVALREERLPVGADGSRALGANVVAEIQGWLGARKRGGAEGGREIERLRPRDVDRVAQVLERADGGGADRVHARGQMNPVMSSLLNTLSRQWLSTVPAPPVFSTGTGVPV